MTYAELLGSGYIEALADAFSTSAEASELLDRAEIPRGRLKPLDALGPVHYWQNVCKVLGNGLIRNGLEKLVEAAAELRPGNEILQGTAVIRQARTPVSGLATPVKIISSSRHNEALKVLFLGANPIESDHLRVDSEARAIKLVAQNSENKPRPIRLEECHAVQPDDLYPALQRAKPTIVHFAGHGKAEGGIVLDDGNGGERTISFEALGHLLGLFSGSDSKVRCVVLNGCWTANAIKGIGKGVDLVLGSSSEIADDSAREFARGFYASLSEGESVGAAIRRGKVEMKLVEPMSHLRGDLPEVFSPESIVVSVREGVDLEELYL